MGGFVVWLGVLLYVAGVMATFGVLVFRESGLHGLYREDTGLLETASAVLEADIAA